MASRRLPGWLAAAAVGATVLVAGGAVAAQAPPADPAERVRDTERAFAKTMADRDHGAFVSFLADDTVFMGERTLRGKGQVAEAWKSFYEGPAAPFSWEPERVEVLDSGTLAFSSGPVFSGGKRVGTFNSVWRVDPDGKWRIVFDKGCPPCKCE